MNYLLSLLREALCSGDPPRLFNLTEIDDVVIRGIRDVEVFHLETRDRDWGALGVVTEKTDLAGDLQPLVLRETASYLVKAEKRDHADVIGTAGVSFSLKYESFLSVLTHEDCLTGDGDTLSVISLDIVESIGVEETEVIGLDDAGIFV